MHNKICCILNLAPHYNEAIYKLIDQELKCDFFIGDRINSPMKLMVYEDLKGFKKRLRFKPLIANFYWQRESVHLAFRNYKQYIITGEPYCISTWLILLITKIIGKKTYLWTHGWYGGETIIKKIIKKIFFSLSNCIFLYGNYARNLMIEEGFRPEKLICVYNSMDYDQQIQIRRNLKKTNILKQYFNNDYPVLLYIGRIQRKKKIDQLLNAQFELNRKGIMINLVIVGKEIEETNINNLILNYNLKNYVWLFGPCFEERILGEIIFNADLCVSPGNIGLSAMHSLVYGTPVLTHNNFHNQMPEFEAIIEGVTGDFFKENSVEDLCKKIENWLNISNKNREIVRKNCYQVIRNKYNPNKQIRIIKAATC